VRAGRQTCAAASIAPVNSARRAGSSSTACRSAPRRALSAAGARVDPGVVPGTERATGARHRGRAPGVPSQRGGEPSLAPRATRRGVGGCLREEHEVSEERRECVVLLRHEIAAHSAQDNLSRC